MSSSVVVLKFGGTSLGSTRRIRHAAGRVTAHLARGRRPVVVVSANGNTTDGILRRIRGLSGKAISADSREVDRALATGEDLSAALLAVALIQAGAAACSLRGAEAGVIADGPFGAGRIQQVQTARIREFLKGGVVPVIAGFQAGRMDGQTVTLGRGGSDISAVAIAAALGVPCHIITDVAAVYDRDPRVHPEAVPLRELDHHGLIELTRRGAEVVHPAAAELAARENVPLQVYHFRAPLSGSGGTRIGSVEQPAAA